MADQRFYDQVAEEIERKQLDNGLWVRAFSLSLGDDSKARAVYISLRVERLQAEHDAEVKSARAAEAARAQQRQAQEAARFLRQQEKARAEALRMKVEEEIKKQQRDQVAQAKRAETALIKAKQKMRKKDGRQAAWSEILEIIEGSWPLCLLLVLIVAIIFLILASALDTLLK